MNRTRVRIEEGLEYHEQKEKTKEFPKIFSSMKTFFCINVIKIWFCFVYLANSPGLFVNSLTHWVTLPQKTFFLLFLAEWKSKKVTFKKSKIDKRVSIGR